MGTTADKLSYLNTTKAKIKESINLTNINITNEPFRYYAYAIKKGIINVLNDPKEIWNNFEKVTGEGTSIELTSTENAPIEINLKGNTSQAGVPTPTDPVEINVVSGDNTIEICGKNILDKSSFLSGKKYNSTGQLENGSANDYYTTKKIYVQPSTTYKGQGTDYWRVCQFDSNNNLVDYHDYSNSTTKPTITTLANTKYLLVSLSGYGGFDSKNIQIEKGDTDTSYTPYVSQTQLISLGVENLFDKDNITSSKALDTQNGTLVDSSVSCVLNYTEVEPNTTYTLSGGTDATKTKKACYYTAQDTSTYLSYNEKVGTGITFTTPNNCYYIRIQVVEAEKDNMQLEKGSKANSFSPYGTTPIKLNKIGNYQDYIYKTDKWYLHKEIGKVVFDGSETWDIATTTGFQAFVLNGAVNTGDLIGFSNYYKNFASSNWTYMKNNDFIVGRNNNQIIIRNDNISTTSDFKTWLSTHNTIVYYPLSTPTDTEITDSTLIYQLEKTLYSYNGQTNISQTNNDLPFILDVKALKLIE